jgi:hypothetical protein
MKVKVNELKSKQIKYFRIAGPENVSPDIWTWDGTIIKENNEECFIVTRVADDFKTILFQEHYIISIDLRSMEKELNENN